MQTFELYEAAWLVYIALGLCLIVLLAYKMKTLNWNVKFAVLSLIGVGALTPDLVTNSETYAPLVLTSFLKAEVEGVSAIISGFEKLLIIWVIIFFSMLAIRYFLKVRSNKKARSNKVSPNKDASNPDTSNPD